MCHFQAKWLVEKILTNNPEVPNLEEIRADNMKELEKKMKKLGYKPRDQHKLLIFMVDYFDWLANSANVAVLPKWFKPFLDDFIEAFEEGPWTFKMKKIKRTEDGGFGFVK